MDRLKPLDEKARSQVTGAIDSFRADGLKTFSPADLASRIADLNPLRPGERLVPLGSLFEALDHLRTTGVFTTRLTETPDPINPRKTRTIVVFELAEKPLPRQ